MKITHKTAVLGIALTMLGAGCAAETTMSEDIPSPVSDDAPSQAAAENVGVVMATLEFSPTHRVELRELAEQKALLITETLSADFDRERGSMLRGFDPRVQTTADLYRALVSETMTRDEGRERAQLATLVDFDARHAKDRQLETTVVSDDGVAAVRSALNAFPDSGADSNWYKANFCEPGARPDDICRTNLEDRTITTPTHKTNFFSGSVFNQCAFGDVNCEGIPSLELRWPCPSTFPPTLCTRPEQVQTIQASRRTVAISAFWQFPSGSSGNIYGFARRDSTNTGFGSQYSFNMRWD